MTEKPNIDCKHIDEFGKCGLSKRACINRCPKIWDDHYYCEEAMSEKLKLPPEGDIYNRAMKRSKKIKEEIMKTEKQKPKVRTVVGDCGVVELRRMIGNCDEGRLRVVSTALADLPNNTKIEFVTVRDAEPERELVKPEGAVWVPYVDRSDTSRYSQALICEAGVVATADDDGSYWIHSLHMGTAKHETIEAAKQAIGEAKATAEEDGFYWREVEPECVQWRLDWTERGKVGSVGYFELDVAWDRYYHRRDLININTLSTDKCFFYGMDRNLEWHEIDRCEAADK